MEIKEREEFFFNSNQSPCEFLNIVTKTRIRIYKNGIGHSNQFLKFF